MFLICGELGKKLLRDVLPLRLSAEAGRNCGQIQHKQVCTYKAWGCFCWRRRNRGWLTSHLAPQNLLT